MIDQEPSGSRASVLGRDAELGFLRDVVVNDAGGRTIVLVGGPGIGKTTLWEAGLRIARGVGVRVLAARPSGSGAQLAFAALIDLCDAVGGEDMADVPPPSGSRWRWRSCALSRPVVRCEHRQSRWGL